MKQNWNESFKFVASLSRTLLGPIRSKFIELYNMKLMIWSCPRDKLTQERLSFCSAYAARREWLATKLAEENKKLRLS
jgi:hypothetical protein